jgi:hypothetical protein
VFGLYNPPDSGIDLEVIDTNAGAAPRRKDYDGTLILPPGYLMSVAASTAAGTTSGLAAQAT